MKKLIRIENERIIEIRPLEELEFLEGFIEVEVPKDYKDIEILTKFIYKNGKFVKTTKFIDLENARIELGEIQVWLSRNDWVPNKIITGEWEATDERWLQYLEERKVKRARQDELKEVV